MLQELLLIIDGSEVTGVMVERRFGRKNDVSHDAIIGSQGKFRSPEPTTHYRVVDNNACLRGIPLDHFYVTQKGKITQT